MHKIHLLLTYCLLALLWPAAAFCKHPAPISKAATTGGRASDTIRRPYHAYLPRHSFLIGTGNGGTFIRVRNSITSPMETANNLQWDPRIGFTVSERICLGVTGTYANAWGTLIDEYSYYGFGAYGRYYLFTKQRAPLINHERIGFFKKGQLFKHANDSQRRLFAEHLFPFIEIGGGLSNLRLNRGPSSILPRPTEPDCRIVLGMDMRLWKCIFFEAGYIQEFYPANKTVLTQHPGARLGIDIIIPTQAQK